MSGLHITQVIMVKETKVLSKLCIINIVSLVVASVMINAYFYISTYHNYTIFQILWFYNHNRIIFFISFSLNTLIVLFMLNICNST